MKNLLFSVEQIESERFLSDVNFCLKSDFSIKIELKNWVSGKIFFSKIWQFEKSFIIRNSRNEKLSIQNLTFWKFFFSNFPCAGKRLLQNLILSFSQISFQTLIFNEKVCYKVMPFKMSTQSGKLVVGRGANRVKTLFLICDVFIEIWFLNENWIQNLNFRKNSLSTKRLLEKNFSKPARTKNSRFKNWSICRKKLHFKIRIFFPKITFQTLIFNGKACFKIMPFKISAKSEKFVVLCGANWVRTFFIRCEFLLEIWFLNKNWTQKLSFWKNFFLQNMTIRKVFYYKKLAERKTLNSKPDLLEIFLFKFSLCRKTFASESDSFFFTNFFSNSDFQWKSLLQSHAS